jgi:hypothetical protein
MSLWLALNAGYDQSCSSSVSLPGNTLLLRYPSCAPVRLSAVTRQPWRSSPSCIPPSSRSKSSHVACLRVALWPSRSSGGSSTTPSRPESNPYWGLPSRQPRALSRVAPDYERIPGREDAPCGADPLVSPKRRWTSARTDGSGRLRRFRLYRPPQPQCNRPCQTPPSRRRVRVGAPALRTTSGMRVHGAKASEKTPARSPQSAFYRPRRRGRVGPTAGQCLPGPSPERTMGKQTVASHLFGPVSTR